MTASPLMLLMVVISRASACPSACADECAFSAADQRSRSGTDGCADADALRGLLFTGFRVSMVTTVTSMLAAGNRNCDGEREH